MSWVRIDDDAVIHLKLRKLNMAARWLWVCGLAHCQKQLTDGFIDAAALPLPGFDAPLNGEAQQLVTVGLWEVVEGGGYRVHDYLDYNATRATVQQRRRADLERKQLGRDTQARVRSESARTPHGIGSDSSGPIPSHPIPSLPSEETKSAAPSAARLQRPSTTTTTKAANGASGDPFTDRVVAERAGRFLERYQQLYPTHRNGARYALRPARDYAAAVTLCQTWVDDTRLDRLAVVFLKTNHPFAEDGSRTVPQFLALASWCDGRLAELEARRR